MDICEEWKSNKTINPRTNRKITKTGKVYRELEIECRDQSPRRPFRRQHYSPKCVRWRKTPTINPETGRTIKIGGPTYTKLEEKCGTLDKPPLKQLMPNKEECKEWIKQPNKNPRTARNINPQGQIYKWYEKHCEGGRNIAGRGRSLNQSSIQSEEPQDQIWFTNRLNVGIRVNNKLRSLNSDQWDMCMTGSVSPVFRSNFTMIREISMGTFGQIYRAKLGEDKLVIKEAYLKPDEKRVLKRATSRNQKWELVKKNSYPHENRILDLVNQLILSHKCPNFVYIYNMAMCDGCKVNTLFNKRPSLGSCYVTFMESANTDLTYITLVNFQQQLSILYQLLIAVYAIHNYYAIWHRDIKTSNVFIKLIKPGGYFEYIIEGNKYYVKNTGLVAYLADFGVSEVLSPIYGFTNYYGTRNAEVMKGDEEIEGSDLYWKPIYIPRIGPEIKWKDKVNKTVIDSTRNTIIGKIPSRMAINLNNNFKFPPFEFYDDIQDVIRMFIGGKQVSQPGYHTAIKNLSEDLKALINEKKAYNDTRNNIYSIYGTVKYILAERMLNTLYIEPSNVDYIVEKFVMA
jgi:serine/threonine protein kinase